MKTDLLNKKCRACELGEGKFGAEEIRNLSAETPDWSINQEHDISKKFKFKNFSEALAFVNKVGALAEAEGHHPDIRFGWGYVAITLSTHAVDGLTENDFIMAAKIDQLR